MIRFRTGRGISMAFLILVSMLGGTFTSCVLAQSRTGSTRPELGIRDKTPQIHVIENAKLVISPEVTIERGSIVIDEGVIKAIGASIAVPEHARRWDGAGKTIYPGLIDAASEVDVPAEPSATRHWNQQVQPERSARDAAWDAARRTDLRKAGFALQLVAPRDGILKGTSVIVTTGESAAHEAVVAENVAQHLRLTVPFGGDRSVYPSSPMGAVALARQVFYDALWYRDAQRAFLNQADAPRPEANVSLESLYDAIDRNALFLFDAMDEQYALRAGTFADEFGLRAAILGSGREYQRLAEIAALHRPLIVPLNFPKAPNVATQASAREGSLADLLHWHFAPENPARLRQAGLEIAFTTQGLEKPSEFHKQIRLAVKRGLDRADALRACTVVPAELFGIDRVAGTLEVGKAAHLMVTRGDWLDEKGAIVETWVDGVRYPSEPDTVEIPSGWWQIELDTAEADRQRWFIHLTRDDKKLDVNVFRQRPEPEAKPSEKPVEKPTETATAADANPGIATVQAAGVADAAKEVKRDANRDNELDTGVKPTSDPAAPPKSVELQGAYASFDQLTGNFSAELWQGKGTIRLAATQLPPASSDAAPKLIGQLVDEQGRTISLTGELVSEAISDAEVARTDTSVQNNANESDASVADKTPSKPADSDASTSEIPLSYPLGANGRPEHPKKYSLVAIENATVWTCGSGGTMQQATVLLQDGKIAAVGTNVAIPGGALRIDAKGKHVTPGIIDCHSHMATDGGINEGTDAITAEVRIGDFIDATDINIYRQLAGGVTTANLLHGSANPIGGQNQVIKLRWGLAPDELKFAEAPGGIKFALGENVKQSNWGEEFTTRYPQTRMGVEQIIRDAFQAAREYQQRGDAWRKRPHGLPPRRDLELDALVEILQGVRWVHCHSYRQDEILALIRTLDHFGIRIATFQHILEGYKVANEMARHGAMASSFSDWWAYKFEVFDAIPYNGALMHQAGIVVSFNSDDQELARHLNHEAAKAVKYGGVAPEEALQFVTLNPAKQLRIDSYVGSIEPGKHADLVIWSGPPLSIQSRCEQTWIDGQRYFDRDDDLAQRQEQQALHARLVRMILDSGEPMEAVGERKPMLRELWPRHDEYCGHHEHNH